MSAVETRRKRGTQHELETRTRGGDGLGERRELQQRLGRLQDEGRVQAAHQGVDVVAHHLDHPRPGQRAAGALPRMWSGQMGVGTRAIVLYYCMTLRP